MGWIEIPHWSDFQHYRDRDPVWIKNYTRLLHDPNYLGLTLQQRGVLHGLWLEYAASNRQIVDSTATISRQLVGRTSRATLESLNQAGFIVISASGRATRAIRSREGERDKPHPPQPPPLNGPSGNGDGGPNLDKILRSIGDV